MATTDLPRSDLVQTKSADVRAPWSEVDVLVEASGWWPVFWFSLGPIPAPPHVIVLGVG